MHSNFSQLGRMVNTVLFPGPLSMSALAVQIWELTIHWGDEVEYLWKGRLNWVKVLYFIARYILLVAQLLSQYLTIYTREYPSRQACRLDLTFVIVLAQGTLTLLEMILLVRVYALYNQSKYSRRLLIVFFVLVMLLETSATGRILGGLKDSSTDACEPPAIGRSVFIHFGIGAGSCQVAVFVLSLNGLLLRRGARTPLTSLMLKEGIAAFLLIVALLVVMMIHYEVLRTLDHGIGKAAFAWYLTLISVGTSRLILNMRRLAVKSMRRRSQRSQHTTTYDINSDEFWDSEDQDEICLTSFYD